MCVYEEEKQKKRFDGCNVHGGNELPYFSEKKMVSLTIQLNCKIGENLNLNKPTSINERDG